MIDKICSDLERKAIMDGHVIGDGFEERMAFGKVPLLVMGCAKCNFFSVVDPKTGRHLQSDKEPCDWEKNSRVYRHEIPLLEESDGK